MTSMDQSGAIKQGEQPERLPSNAATPEMIEEISKDADSLNPPRPSVSQSQSDPGLLTQAMADLSTTQEIVTPPGTATLPTKPQGPIVRDFAAMPTPIPTSTLTESSRLPENAVQVETANTTNATPPSPTAPMRPTAIPRTGSAPVIQPSATNVSAMPKGLGALRGRASGSQRNIPIPPSLQARVAAGLQNRNNAMAASSANATHLTSSERIDAAAILNAASSAGPNNAANSRPRMPAGINSSPSVPVPGRQMPGGPPGANGLAARRRNLPGLSLGGIGSDADGAPAGRVMANGTGAIPGQPAARRRPPPGLSLGGAGRAATPFSNFNKIVDPSGRLSFENKAVVHARGVDFSNGASFNINMDDLTLEEELGRGNYGTVQRVLHKRTNVVMAMKEIRLELDESKLKAIITELDILHRASAPEIVEFYGAFFIESCVYYCMEYMDAGSLAELGGGDMPEDVLARVTSCMVKGLRFLKDELQTMHRDVKPTNVLVNRKGEIKLCDFGVSVQLEKSLAKTNIGCQSYMAPERIKGESMGAVSTYTVASDVWSLGLTIIEFSIGHYPYPPETYSNVFAQLQAIVHGDPPGLPDGYSADANDFVAATLRKDANKRPSYRQLENHPFLAQDKGRQVNMVGWVAAAMERRKTAQTPSSASSESPLSSA